MFDDSLILTGSCVIYSNKYTNLPTGKFMLNEISFRGVKIDRFEVGYGKSSMQKS